MDSPVAVEGSLAAEQGMLTEGTAVAVDKEPVLQCSQLEVVVEDTQLVAGDTALAALPAVGTLVAAPAVGRGMPHHLSKAEDLLFPELELWGFVLVSLLESWDC